MEPCLKMHLCTLPRESETPDLKVRVRVRARIRVRVGSQGESYLNHCVLPPGNDELIIISRGSTCDWSVVSSLMNRD